MGKKGRGEQRGHTDYRPRLMGALNTARQRQTERCEKEGKVKAFVILEEKGLPIESRRFVSIPKLAGARCGVGQSFGVEGENRPLTRSPTQRTFKRGKRGWRAFGDGSLEGEQDE